MYEVVAAGGDPNLPFAVQKEGSDEFLCLCFNEEDANLIRDALNKKSGGYQPMVLY